MISPTVTHQLMYGQVLSGCLGLQQPGGHRRVPQLAEDPATTAAGGGGEAGGEGG